MICSAPPDSIAPSMVRCSNGYIMLKLPAYMTSSNLLFLLLLGRDNMVPVGEIIDGVLVIRGYQVNEKEVPGGSSSIFMEQVCGFMPELSSVQFRWLQTSLIGANDFSVRDEWTLDDVEISYQEVEGERNILLEDSFDGNQLK